MALKQMEAKKVTVGDNSFHIKPFPAFKAANLTGELASVLSPLIGGATEVHIKSHPAKGWLFSMSAEFSEKE